MTHQILLFFHVAQRVVLTTSSVTVASPKMYRSYHTNISHELQINVTYPQASQQVQELQEWKGEERRGEERRGDEREGKGREGKERK